MDDIRTRFYIVEGDVAKEAISAFRVHEARNEKLKQDILFMSGAKGLDRDVLGFTGLIFDKLPSDSTWYFRRKVQEEKTEDGMTVYVLKPKPSSKKGAKLAAMMHRASLFDPAMVLSMILGFYYEIPYHDYMCSPVLFVQDDRIIVCAPRYVEEEKNLVPVPKAFQDVTDKVSLGLKDGG